MLPYNSCCCCLTSWAAAWRMQVCLVCGGRLAFAAFRPPCTHVCGCVGIIDKPAPAACSVSVLHMTSAGLVLHLPPQASSRRRCKRRGRCARKASGSQPNHWPAAHSCTLHCSEHCSLPLHVSCCVMTMCARAQRAVWRPLSGSASRRPAAFASALPVLCRFLDQIQASRERAAAMTVEAAAVEKQRRLNLIVVRPGRC